MGVVRLPILFFLVVAVVGGHDGQPGAPGDLQQPFERDGLLGNSVIHQLDKKVALAQNIRILGGGLHRPVHVAEGAGAGHMGFETAGKNHQAFRVPGQELQVYARVVIETFKIAVGNQFQQILVTGLVPGQDREVAVVFSGRSLILLQAGTFGGVNLAADDGPDAGGGGGEIEFHGAVHIAVVGESQSGDFPVRQPFEELGRLSIAVGDAQHPVQERIFRVIMKMDKARGFHYR